MKQYKYRATDFHRVDWARLREQVRGERVVFAIDVAKQDFMAAVMTPDRAVQVTVKWRHPQDTRALIGEVASLGAVEAVMESSGTYGDGLRYHLRGAGVAVYRMSAKRVHDAAEIYDGVPSLHDAKAAYVIARLHLEGVSRRWTEAEVKRRTLQSQLARLQWYQERRQRASNRLEARLARHWPEAEGIVGLETASLRRLLAHYGDPAAVACDAEGARALLRRTGGSGLRAEKIEALVASAATTLGVPCVSAEAEQIRELAAELEQMQAQCRALEQALEDPLQGDAGLQQQARAVGRTTTAVLHSSLGDVRAYPSADSYAKACGLNLKERSSGKHQGQLRITKRGPALVRLYLYFAVLRLIARPGPARRWYEAKVARDGGVKAKAITALMRKLARALWHVGHGVAFDQALLFAKHRPERQAVWRRGDQATVELEGEVM